MSTAAFNIETPRIFVIFHRAGHLLVSISKFNPYRPGVFVWVIGKPKKRPLYGSFLFYYN